jgi:NADH:ubiquinone oxidoreductase subunit F (NADH-binding)
MGLCSHGPLVWIEAKGQKPVLFKEVEPLIARLVVVEYVLRAIEVPEGDSFEVPTFLRDYTLSLELPFFKDQQRIVLANAGSMDPENIDEYIVRDGYKALQRILTGMKPEEVIREVKESGLRGRGGAGFPTGIKWENTRLFEGGEKFVICNGDEGDPGAYMDRSILEADPHAVIEGMAIAAYAVGATTGLLYIRAEYPLAVDRVQKAIKQAKKYGLLGKRIMDSEFSFDCEVRLGAGAFVCGEETALISSIEGKRGTPYPRPPYPSESGLWGKPTSVNNVETLANVPHILRNGSAWFANIGTEDSKGTKVFALTGKVNYSGLIEIPMGISIREVIDKIAGGVSTDKRIKAVQTGGPSGGIIPEHMLDIPVCYQKIEETGSMMGSGGMIVLDEDDSMVDIAAFYLGFTVDESCGKCAPCRVGGKQLLDLVQKIADGKGTERDLTTIRRIGEAMKQGSLCGLGQTAPTPVLSTLNYFEDEYRAKLKKEETHGTR